jgi:hypothetical protein
MDHLGGSPPRGGVNPAVGYRADDVTRMSCA